jgi:hypothetical protein
MSRTVVTITLCLLLSVHLAMQTVNLSRASQAAVAGLKAKELDADPDFVSAVKVIVDKCRLNVSLGSVKC